MHLAISEIHLAFPEKKPNRIATTILSRCGSASIITGYGISYRCIRHLSSSKEYTKQDETTIHSYKPLIISRLKNLSEIAHLSQNIYSWKTTSIFGDYLSAFLSSLTQSNKRKSARIAHASVADFYMATGHPDTARTCLHSVHHRHQPTRCHPHSLHPLHRGTGLSGARAATCRACG